MQIREGKNHARDLLRAKPTDSQSLVLRLICLQTIAWAPIGNLLEKCFPGLLTDQLNQKLWGWGPKACVATALQGLLMCKV